MNLLTKIVINNTVYYLLDEFKNMPLQIKIKQKSSARKLINDLQLNTNNYIFAYNKGDEWIESKSTYSRAKILIKKDYADNILFDTSNDSNVNANANANNDSNEAIELLTAPKLVIDEKEINIEVRYIGTISQDTLLFRVKDVAQEFNSPKLRDSITQKNSSYVVNEDYKYIKIYGSKGRPYLYLTFLGLLRFAFVSRSSNTSKKITKWANDILFTHQYGSNKQRNELATTLTSSYQSIVSDIFSKFEFPCIYLLGIGNYREFTNVYKFGRTDNFNRRYKEHSKMYNVVPTVCILQYIDTDYLSKAEVDIKNYMSSINALIQTENHDELVSLSDKQLKMVISVYKDMSHKYSSKIDVLQDRINELNHQIELLVRDNEIKILKEQQKLLEKDNRILQLENELLKISRK